MGQCLSYLYHSPGFTQWIAEGAVWQPPEPLTLRDEAGVVIPSSQMATMVMTIYDLMDPSHAIITGADHVDIKNLRGCTLSTQGVLVLKLQPSDTVILQPVHDYELRRLLVEYTWPLVPVKADCLEVTVVIRNVLRRPV